jgi:RNA polymerase sigma-70 factor (ECF subfamily)
MAQHATPEELLARVAKRDANALGELYDHFASRLYRTLLRILADRRAAEAVLEDVFLRLWNEARRVRHEPVSVAAWLTVTALSTGINRLRARRALAPLRPEKSIPLEKSASWLPSPEEIALLEERHELLKKVASQLPAAQRQLLELLVFEGYTEKEIAHKLGEPLGKVKTGLRAGLTFLRHRLRAVLGTWAANI